MFHDDEAMLSINARRGRSLAHRTLNILSHGVSSYIYMKSGGGGGVVCVLTGHIYINKENDNIFFDKVD